MNKTPDSPIPTPTLTGRDWLTVPLAVDPAQLAGDDALDVIAGEVKDRLADDETIAQAKKAADGHRRLWAMNTEAVARQNEAALEFAAAREDGDLDAMEAADKKIKAAEYRATNAAQLAAEMERPLEAKLESVRTVVTKTVHEVWHEHRARVAVERDRLWSQVLKSIPADRAAELAGVVNRLTLLDQAGDASWDAGMRRPIDVTIEKLVRGIMPIAAAKPSVN